MTSTQNPQVKVTKGEARYDGTVAYDVSYDGVRIGRVWKSESRSQVLSGMIAVGTVRRATWAVEGIGWRNRRGERYHFNLDRTKTAAVNGLVRSYLANKEA